MSEESLVDELKDISRTLKEGNEELRQLAMDIKRHPATLELVRLLTKAINATLEHLNSVLKEIYEYRKEFEKIAHTRVRDQDIIISELLSKEWCDEYVGATIVLLHEGKYAEVKKMFKRYFKDEPKTLGILLRELDFYQA